MVVKDRSDPYSIFYMKRIGLLGPYGTGNLGDAAIQEAVIQNIKEHYPSAHIYGISENPIDTAQRHHIQSFPISRLIDDHIVFDHREGKYRIKQEKKGFFPEKIPIVRIIYRILIKLVGGISFIVKSFQLIRKIDLLIVSGGGQLDDFWGGAWGHPYTVFKWAVLAKASRTPLVFMSVGADSISTSMGMIFIKLSLLMANYRSFRDDKTRQFAISIGVGHGNEVYPDLAYSLPILRNRYVLDRKDGSSQMVGISPIAAEAWTDRNNQGYKNYITQLVCVSEWLLNKNYTVLYFSTQTNMDNNVIEVIINSLNLQDRLKNDGKIIYTPVNSLDDLLSQISNTDIVIASRLHGVLLSHLMFKPVLAISYSKKVDIHMEDLGLLDYCIDIKSIDFNRIVDKFLLVESEKSNIEKKLIGSVIKNKLALDEQYRRVFDIWN